MATSEADSGFGANIALKDLAVVTHVFDDIVCPIIAEAQLFALATLNAQETLYFGIFGTLHLIDIGLRDALFLCRNRRVEDPSNDIGPLVVTLTGGGS